MFSDSLCSRTMLRGGCTLLELLALLGNQLVALHCVPAVRFLHGCYINTPKPHERRTWVG